MKDVTLSEHFKLSEFTRSETARRNFIRNTPPPTARENILTLVSMILEPARRQLGEPIAISSGYRCKKLNDIIGGAYNSQHLCGEAADIILPSPQYAKRLIDILKENPNVDQLLYEHKGQKVWLHVSCATTRKPRRMIRLHYKA